MNSDAIFELSVLIMTLPFSVTGASSGIGAETARVLALRGVHVIMGVRNLGAGHQSKEAIIKEVPNAKLDAMELDLSSMTSIRNFASKFNSLGLPLNVLVLVSYSHIDSLDGFYLISQIYLSDYYMCANMRSHQSHHR